MKSLWDVSYCHGCRHGCALRALSRLKYTDLAWAVERFGEMYAGDGGGLVGAPQSHQTTPLVTVYPVFHLLKIRQPPSWDRHYHHKLKSAKSAGTVWLCPAGHGYHPASGSLSRCNCVSASFEFAKLTQPASHLAYHYWWKLKYPSKVIIPSSDFQQ